MIAHKARKQLNSPATRSTYLYCKRLKALAGLQFDWVEHRCRHRARLAVRLHASSGLFYNLFRRSARAVSAGVPFVKHVLCYHSHKTLNILTRSQRDCCCANYIVLSKDKVIILVILYIYLM